MVSTVTYVSTLQDSVGPAELDALLEASRERNAAAGVTGLLLVRDRQVMQVLEGDEPEVRRLYAEIREDPRHRDVTQVWRSVGRSRRFPDWSMGFEDLDDDPEVTGSPLADAAVPTDVDGQLEIDGEQRAFLDRRIVLLRRGLANGSRLVSSLSVILDAHDVETVDAGDGAVTLRCRQGCATDAADAPAYPCYTAQNAFWALDATV